MSSKIFKYAGFSIPTGLVMLTGGGTDDWERISKYHVEMYRKYTPINSDDFVLEVGCGVGRDAIELTKILSGQGTYKGIDIIKPSIDWAKNNITKRHSNFTFHYFDIQSQIHNDGGKIKTTDIKLPAANNSVDRIFLHSVFTHMFEKDILHYLKEFSRVLKPDGLVLTSFFIIDDLAKKHVRKGLGKKHRHPLMFDIDYGNGCYINDRNFPEGAVGYTPEKLKSMLVKGGLILHDGVMHRGVWSGIKDGSNGQDIVVLRKAEGSEAKYQLSKPVRFSNR